MAKRTDKRDPSRYVTVVRHRVPFYETDAMGVVHHANYVHWLEVARLRWLEEHDQPYRFYTEQGFNFAVTHIELDYRRAVAFDDEVETIVWVESVRGASLTIGYEIRCHDQVVVTARTEHALVDATGRPRRIPPEQRENLALKSCGNPG